MNSKTFTVKGTVQIFPQQGGWIYVSVPKKLSELAKGMKWGLVPITAQVGKTSWNTSLLPMGDGTHFIPLNAKVRKKEDIAVPDTIRLLFKLR